MPPTREELLVSISGIIQDYREADRQGLFGLPVPNTVHVERWINQFDADVQLPILNEVAHVLSSTYINKGTVDGFLTNMVSHPRLVGDNPGEYWQRANLLDIQQRGQSQQVMLARFKELIEEACGIEHTGDGTSDDCYVYIDDISFSGGRVNSDLEAWIRNDAPANATVDILLLAYHTYGQYSANSYLQGVAREVGKTISLKWWYIKEIENRLACLTSSDVLRPTVIPEDEAVQAYFEEVNSEQFPIALRQPGNIGTCSFFSSEEGRAILEQEFLKKGVEIRAACPNLNEYQRPLGNMIFDSLGFGSMLVTYRNCPNNCPLVFWVDAPWYPLFPRVIN